MTKQNYLFALFLSLAAAAAGGLFFNTPGTPIENAIIGMGLLAVILFSFIAGFMQAYIMQKEQRQRGLSRANEIERQAGREPWQPPIK